MWKHIARPLLFVLPPEWAHGVSLWALRWLGWLGWLWPRPAPSPFFAAVHGRLMFSNPLGLAAGYDKDARIFRATERLGFGFCECGTITWHPQKGQTRPRLFRLRAERALVNRLGFNNQGAAAALRRLARAPARARTRVGVNISFNASGAPAAGDMRMHNLVRAGFLLAPHAAYVALNLSSPNTPGLRDWQTPERVGLLVHALRQAIGECPLFVKLSPDLPDDAVRTLARRAMEEGASGLIVGNTTTADARAPNAPTGGLSGPALHQRNLALLKLCHQATEGRACLIAAGGLETAAQAYDKLRAGAHLLQLYTGLVYHGPGLPRRILRELESAMRRDGFAHYAEAIGCDAPPFRTEQTGSTEQPSLWARADCSKSRAVAAFLRGRGYAPHCVYDYTRPPTRAELEALLEQLRLPPQALWRKQGPLYRTQNLALLQGRDAVLDALCKHWQLIERPIVLSGGRAVIARPATRALDVLPS